MVNISYDIHSGILTATGSYTGTELTIRNCSSGFSNKWWNSPIRETSDHPHGTKKHQCGGRINLGRWRVLRPGSRHPDEGNLRTDWIPIGPVRGRRHLYIHCGTRTEGCINVPKLDQRSYDRLKRLVQEEQGGWIEVTSVHIEVDMFYAFA
jgi:hypothetical protein